MALDWRQVMGKVIPPTLALYLVILVLAMMIAWTNTGRLLDHWLLDTYWSWQHASTDAASDHDPVIVGIDEAFLEHIDEPIALIHGHIASFLFGLAEAGPKVLGIDLVLPEKRFDKLKSTISDDTDYHRTLLRSLMSPAVTFPVMVAKTWDHERSQFRDIMPDYAVALEMREWPSGFVSSLFCADADGVIRSSPGAGCQPGDQIGLAEAMFRLSATEQTSMQGLINFGEGPAWTYIPFQTVLDWIRQGDKARLQKTFAGRMVLLGTTFSDTDLLKTPVSLINWTSSQKTIPGMIIHAQILRTLVNNSLIRETPAALTATLVLLASLVWFRESSRRKFLVVGACLFVLPIVSLLVLYHRNYWFPFMGISFMLVLSSSLRGMYDGLTHYLMQQRLKSTFAGYVSPSVLTQITSGNITADRGGVSTYMCVLFSDIRGFTTLSEHHDPKIIVDILNRYFDRMTLIVHKYQGTVDKFIGDGMMAFFGAPNVLENPDQQAVAAAQEMRAAMVEFNVEMQAMGYPTLEIGIGLHSGEAIVGNVGARQRHAYTAIGDTVNTASRLESICKTVGYGLVCSGNVYEAVGRPADWVSLGEQALKGRASMDVFGWEPGRTQV